MEILIVLFIKFVCVVIAVVEINIVFDCCVFTCFFSNFKVPL